MFDYTKNDAFRSVNLIAIVFILLILILMGLFCIPPILKQRRIDASTFVMLVKFTFLFIESLVGWFLLQRKIKSSKSHPKREFERFFREQPDPRKIKVLIYQLRNDLIKNEVLPPNLTQKLEIKLQEYNARNSLETVLELYEVVVKATPQTLDRALEDFLDKN